MLVHAGLRLCASAMKRFALALRLRCAIPNVLCCPDTSVVTIACHAIALSSIGRFVPPAKLSPQELRYRMPRESARWFETVRQRHEAIRLCTASAVCSHCSSCNAPRAPSVAAWHVAGVRSTAGMAATSAAGLCSPAVATPSAAGLRGSAVATTIHAAVHEWLHGWWLPCCTAKAAAKVAATLGCKGLLLKLLPIRLRCERMRHALPPLQELRQTTKLS